MDSRTTITAYTVDFKHVRNSGHVDTFMSSELSASLLTVNEHNLSICVNAQGALFMLRLECSITLTSVILCMESCESLAYRSSSQDLLSEGLADMRAQKSLSCYTNACV